MMRDEIKISPAIHEATVEHFRNHDPITRQPQPDEALDALSDAVRLLRESAQTIVDGHRKILANKMQTPLANLRQSHKMIEAVSHKASARYNAARAFALRAIEKIEKETAAPPIKPTEAMLSAEIRSALAAMNTDKRRETISGAIESGDDATIGAVLNGPAFLSGLSVPEQANYCNLWRLKRFRPEMNRVDRLKKAVSACERAEHAFAGMIHGADPTKNEGIIDVSALKRAEAEQRSALEAVTRGTLI